MKNLIMIGVMGSMLVPCSNTKNVAVMDSPPPHSGVDKEVYEYKSKLANQYVRCLNGIQKFQRMSELFLQLVMRCHQTYSCLMILQSYLQREHLLTVSTVNCVLKQSHLYRRLV